jgi:dienelactone hydrolase
MHASRAVTMAIGVLVFATSSAVAADPTPGEMVEVVCKASPDQKYSCYVPKAYDGDKAWPILYCFSPNANGDSFVERYRDVCEERGWIVVGSMNSKNGPWAPIKAAIDAMWADTGERFNLSTTMRYASGFSGGSRVSFAVAAQHPTFIGGVIGIGAGLPDAKAPRPGLATFLTCGTGDPNKAELDPLFEQLKKAGNPVRYENFDGGHDMPPTELMEKAVRWLDDIAPEKKAQQFRAALDEVLALEKEEPVAAWRALVELLDGTSDTRKDLAKEATATRKRLERLPDVKPEVAARKLYVAAVGWLEKNAERVKKFPAARQQAVKKFRAVVTKFPDTAAGEAAGARVEALEAQ